MTSFLFKHSRCCIFRLLTERLDTCFRKVNTKFVSPNSIGFTITVIARSHFRRRSNPKDQKWIASSCLHTPRNDACVA
ncbi:hypothetical protein [Candidatus Tisiphia endosymbiont of Hybos culiciformis]|uniref:hypothetical protein n=1 Tax=Candidatus Tisiphia endosymbiont of Hybos culiciformis TaxID=3139331 RepID=UPI003CCA88B6